MDMLQLDLKVPRNHWTALSREDQASFMQLHLHFIRQQKEHLKDRRNNTFFTDIQCLLQFIEYSPLRKDDRAICVGLACSGPFVCVNTQQIKIILGRCKSSINNSFQLIGYEAVKTKGKSRDAILAIIPALQNEQNTLRKWTVRCASETSTCCFVSRFQMVDLPFISDDDLYDEKKSVRSTMAAFQRQRRENGKSRQIMFNLQQSPPSPPSPFQPQTQQQYMPPQPFMPVAMPQQTSFFSQNQGQFQAPSMYQMQPPSFSGQQQGQLYLSPMNFRAMPPTQNQFQFQQPSMQQQQPIVMQPIMVNQPQSQPQLQSQPRQIQDDDDDGPLTMMHDDNFDVGISFFNDDDIMPMSHSLDYLAAYNDDDDDISGSNFGFNKSVSSPLDPSSLFSFPRSQSASFNPNDD